MKYRHPHDETTIIDNTELQQEVLSNTGAALFMPFISDKGIDGEVTTLTDLSKCLRDFGEPNFRKHGQSYLQVTNWLANKGIVRGIRLTADNASYSNLVVLAEIDIHTVQKNDPSGQPLYQTPEGLETTEASGNTPVTMNKAVIKIIGQSIEGLTTKDRLSVLDKMKSLGSTSGTKTTVPLFTCVSKGKGTYGDMYRLRMAPDLMSDKQTAYRNYTVELFENVGGLKRIEDPLSASLYPSAMDGYKRSQFIDDIIKTNLYPILLYSNEQSFDIITELLKPIINADKDTSFNTLSIDYLFGLNKAGVQYANVEIDPTGINLSALEGVQLASGSDGDFAMTNPDRDTAIYNKFKSCYNGEVDKAVFNTKKFPAAVMLDANFPIEVKKAMQACRTKRNDCVLILDAGIQLTLLAAKSWRKQEMPVDDYSTAVYFQHFSTKDQYTGKEIQVTVPYLLSMMLPKHFSDVGDHKPMAGVNYPITDVILQNSLKPAIMEDEDKSEFYDMRLNYIEEDIDFMILATQLTSQNKDSELSNLNNVYVLYEMKKTIENLVPRFRYEFTETDDDMANFNRMANQALSAFQDYKCKQVSVDISQTQYQKERKILSTVLQVYFKSFNERNDIVMNIQR